MTPLKYFFNSLKFFIPLVFFSATVAAQVNVGYVAEVRGNWYSSGSALRQGQKLPASGVIEIKSPGRFDFIKIADLNGTIRINQKCADDCSFRLPGAPAEPSFFSALLSTVMNLIWSSPPERYSVQRNRGENINDGVARLEKNKVDLSNFIDFDRQYLFRSRKIIFSSKEKFGDWSPPAEIKNENDAKFFPAEKFQAGLYEFEVLRKNAAGFEPVASAWLLINAGKKYEKNKKLFADFTASVNKLTEPTIEESNGQKREIAGIGTMTARQLSRAYLDVLAGK